MENRQLLSADNPIAPSVDNTVSEIREAFTEGGPLIASWNTNDDGWSLQQQVEWIKEGHHIFPTIRVPLLSQGANQEQRWQEWHARNASALQFINDNQLPITLRFHNWLSEFTLRSNQGGRWRLPNNRWEESPLVWRRLPDRTIDDVPIVDPLGPVKPWIIEGQAIATSNWMRNLAEVLPNVPLIYLVENNEAPKHTVYSASTVHKNPSGLRQWKAQIRKDSIRLDQFVKRTGASVDEANVMYARKWAEKYAALGNAIKDNMPNVWQGRVLTGGYGGLFDVMIRGLNTKWDYQDDPLWDEQPWGESVGNYDVPSTRVYHDMTKEFDDQLRSPQYLLYNLNPAYRYLKDMRPQWFSDTSFWVSPTRAKETKDGHGGYTLPPRVLGLARNVLWAAPTQDRATVLRWFAGSTVKLSDPFFNPKKVPPALRGFSQADYFQPVMDAVDEIWTNEQLLDFWRHGEPILNDSPHFSDWNLPEELLDDRSRLLDVDVNLMPDRGRSWQETKITVWAMAYKLDDSYMVYAWAPHGLQKNVTVTVPGVGDMLLESVTQAGVFVVKPIE